MKFVIVGFIFLAIFLALYLTVSWWQKTIRQSKEDPKTKPTEPSLEAVKQDEKKEGV
jgi:hypothetical protein